MKRLLENGSWKTLTAAIGLIIALATVIQWKVMADVSESFISKTEAASMELRITEQIGYVRADIAALRKDVGSVMLEIVNR